MTALPLDEPDHRIVFAPFFMIKKPAAAPVASAAPDKETEPQRFDRILSRPEFKPLKAVFDHLGADSAARSEEHTSELQSPPRRSSDLPVRPRTRKPNRSGSIASCRALNSSR